MKKLLTVLLTVLLFSVQTVPALADDSTAATQPIAVQSQSSTSTTSADPEIAVVKAKMQTIIQLRAQNKTLNQQLSTQTQTNKNLIAGLHNENDQSSVSAIKQVRDNNQTLKAQIQPILDQIKNLRTQMQSTTDKSAKAQLRTQIQGLIAQITPIKQQMKSNLDGIKSDIAAVKAQQQTRKTAMQPVKDLWTAQKSLWAQVKTLEQQRQTLWNTAAQQRKDKDYTSLSGTLDQIIALNTQIQGIKSQILTNKQQVTQLLQAMGTTTP